MSPQTMVPAHVRDLLAPYPHAGTCLRCLAYAEQYLGAYPASSVLVATLNHHETSHACDHFEALNAYF